MEDLRNETVNEEVEETTAVEAIDNEVEETNDPDCTEYREVSPFAVGTVMTLASVGAATAVYGATKGIKKLIGFAKGKIAAFKARKAQKDDGAIHEGECEEVSE